MKANKGKRLTDGERAHVVELLRQDPNTARVKAALAAAKMYTPTTQTICRIARLAIPPVVLSGGGRPVGAKDKGKRKQSSKHRIPVLELAAQGMDAAEIMIVTGLKRGHVKYLLRPVSDGSVK